MPIHVAPICSYYMAAKIRSENWERSIYVCMYVCMDGCMYVCMYVYILLLLLFLIINYYSYSYFNIYIYIYFSVSISSLKFANNGHQIGDNILGETLGFSHDSHLFTPGVVPSQNRSRPQAESLVWCLPLLAKSTPCRTQKLCWKI